MTAVCALLLEVFAPVSIYDPSAETVDWEVSSEPDHPAPYLLAPRNYAEQEIDPVQCTATIGTVEIGVVDVPMVAGDQSTGWMTARVHDLLGRRCRLRRWISDTIGWVTIADGPAGPPRMDPSYAAYRWSIRDTRETERKLAAFGVGGVTGIVPRGPLYGFGQYTDDSGDRFLLDRVLDYPIRGTYQVFDFNGLKLGLINLAPDHYTPGVGVTATLDDAALIMDPAAQDAIQIVELATDTWGPKTADALWRRVGHTAWNVTRPTYPVPQPFVGTAEALLDGLGDVIVGADYVTVFLAPTIPAGFPLATCEVEVIVRYRGPATEDFPYYVEGVLGDVLLNLYAGVYSVAPTAEITGAQYDPSELDQVDESFLTRIQLETGAFTFMLDHVRLRQTEAVDDVRAWAETALYAPSGWIPTLNEILQLSPLKRDRPKAANVALILDSTVTSPNPDWQTGERTVSTVSFTYPRYFVPDPTDPTTKVMADGLAQRPVTLEFTDFESGLRYGPHVEAYDASAFAAVGTADGSNIPGQTETASILAQTAKFEVLDRYRAGVQSTVVSARRTRIPNVRVGDWVPWSLMHLPSRATGLRGSEADAAQIVGLRDDDCVWRTLTLEESMPSDGPPGRVISLVKTDDQPSTGGTSLVVLSDVEHV